MHAHVFLFLLLQPLNSDGMEVALPGHNVVLIISEDSNGPVEWNEEGIRLEVRPRVREDKDILILAMERTGRADLALLAAAVSHWPDGWWFLDF